MRAALTARKYEKKRKFAMSEKKSRAQARYDALAYEKKNYFETASEQERRAMFAYAEGYKAFLNEAKTEREACAAAVRMAEEKLEAAVFDLLKAEEAAEETNALLDDEVHPVCDYSLYLAIHDSVSDIVNWQREGVWRNQKEE